MRISVFFTLLKTLLLIALLAGCNGIYREEVRPTRTYSKSYFFHVVRYHGETLTLISRWYTGSDANATELRRQNRYIAPVNEELPLNAKILIPRRMLQTMKLMPIGFIRKNSADLEYEEEEAVPTARPVSTAIPTITPRDTATPTPTPTNTPEPQPTDEPTATPTPRPTTPIITRPRADRQDFSDEDPSESPNTQIQIPQDIVNELKSLGTAPKTKPQRVQPEQPLEVFETSPFDEATAVPQIIPERPNSLPQYEIPPAEEPEIEPTISEDRKRLLEILQGKHSR